jgi:hypothetical protein
LQDVRENWVPPAGCAAGPVLGKMVWACGGEQVLWVEVDGLIRLNARE